MIISKNHREIISGWWFGCHGFYFPINIGNLIHHPNWRTHIFSEGFKPYIGIYWNNSSSQLTNSYFSEGFNPSTNQISSTWLSPHGFRATAVPTAVSSVPQRSTRSGGIAAPRPCVWRWETRGFGAEVLGWWWLGKSGDLKRIGFWRETISSTTYIPI